MEARTVRSRALVLVMMQSQDRVGSSLLGPEKWTMMSLAPTPLSWWPQPPVSRTGWLDGQLRVVLSVMPPERSRVAVV